MTPEETASALPEPSLLAFPDWLEQNQATIKEPLQKYRGYSDYVKQETLAQGRYSDTLVAKLDTKLAGLAVESGDYALPEGATEYNPADVLARPVSEEIPAKSILNFAYSTDVADDDPLRPTAAKYEAVRRLADEGRATPEELAAAEADLRQIATPEIMSRATRKDVIEGRSLAAIVPPEDPNGAPTVEINDSLLGFVNEDGTVDEPALGKALKMHNTDASLIPAIRAKLARPEGYAKTAMEIEKHGEAMSILDTVARTADPENRFAVFDELGKIANSRERGNSYATEFGVFNLRRAMGEQAKGKSDAELLTLADDFNNMNAMPELDEADPAKSLRRLSTGQVVAPLNLMLNDTAFEKAVNDPSVPLTQRDHLRLQRDYAVEASASDIIRTIADNPQGGDEFVAYMDAQRSQGVKDSEIVKGWIGMGKFSATKSTLAGLRSSLGEAVMPFVALATGSDPDGFAIGAMKGAQIEDSNRRAYADLFGKKHGMVYDLGRLVAPVAVDLGAAFLTRGVATGAVAVGKATAGAAVRNVMKTALNAPTRSIMQSWIKAGAASTAKGMGVKLTGRETADEVVSMAGRDIVSKIATGTAYATSMATGFNRSALSTYASLSTALSNQTNPDGTPKYTQEEVREIAMTHGLAAGTITAGVMAGFFGLGAPGMEMVLRKGLTNGQYARIAGRLKKDVAGFGAADANTMIAQFVKQGVTPLFKSPALLSVAQEGAEEGLDEFMQYFNEARAMGDRISIADAAKQAIYAASLGGVMGGTIAGVGTAIKDRSTPSPQVEADIRRERLLEMATKLEATAPQTAQVFRNYAFQQRALVPQRQQLEGDLKAAKTPEAKAEIKAKIDTLNEQATRSRTEELAPTEENIPQADAAEGDVEAPVDAGMAPEGETVAEGTPEGGSARRTLGGFTGTPVAQRMRATRETVETEFAELVEEKDLTDPLAEVQGVADENRERTDTGDSGRDAGVTGERPELRRSQTEVLGSPQQGVRDTSDVRDQAGGRVSSGAERAGSGESDRGGRSPLQGDVTESQTQGLSNQPEEIARGVRGAVPEETQNSEVRGREGEGQNTQSIGGVSDNQLRRGTGSMGLVDTATTRRVWRGDALSPKPKDYTRRKGVYSGEAHGVGAYYGLEPATAERFSKKGTVKESEVTLENPLVLRSDEDVTRARKEASRITGQPVESGPAHILDGEEAFWFTRALLQQGYDGVILEHKEAPGGPQLVVFNADQVGYKPSLRDQIRKELDRDNVEGAIKLTEGVDKKTLEEELQTFIPSFNAKTAKELRQRFANASSSLTKTAVTKAARDRSIRFVEQELREALANQKRHADGYLGQPMGEASRGIPATEEQLRDPHGIGKEVVARMWQAEVDAARAKLDSAKGTPSDTLPNLQMPPRKRSLSSMRDATRDKLDAIDRRLARESDTENYGVLEAGKQRLTALLGKIETVMLAEAQEARAKVYAEDGTVRPSADPADAVTIAEAEDVPVVEVVKGGMAVRQEALDAGLDRKTADGLGAAADLAAMFREMGDRTPQQLREARVKNYEGDLEKLPNGTTIHGSLFDKFIPEGNQTVGIRRNKKGEVEVFASEASWTPSGEPKAKLTHKVGEVLVTFPSVADFVDAAYGTPITPRPKLSEGATQTIIQSRGVGNFSGPRNADVRAAIMSEIEGKKVPKSKAGYNAFVDAVANHFGITKEGKTINAYETAINQVVRDSVAPAPAPASSTEPVISDILADVPEGYPLDREEAKLLATAAVMPGGLVSALNSNKYVVQAVKRYAASKGIATEGMNATDLAIVVGGEIEADSVLAELRGESVPAPEVPAAPVAEALKKGDRFTDAQGNTWEVWTTRQGNLQAHPVVNGKAVVNRESGVMFAITEESKSRNPNYRTDIVSTVETTQVPAVSQRDTSKPEQMTTAEWEVSGVVKPSDVTISVEKSKGSAQESLDSWVVSRQDKPMFKAISDTYGVPLSSMYEVVQLSRGKWAAGPTHQHQILLSAKESKPVSAEAVDTYGIKLPEGYVKQGDLYVFNPTSPEPLDATDLAVIGEGELKADAVIAGLAGTDVRETGTSVELPARLKALLTAPGAKYPESLTSEGIIPGPKMDSAMKAMLEGDLSGKKPAEKARPQGIALGDIRPQTISKKVKAENMNTDAGVISALKNVASSDTTRYILNSVLFDKDNQLLVATDGRMLITVPAKVTRQRIIATNDSAVAKSVSKYAEGVAIPKSMKAGAEMEGNYPNWKMVIPDYTTAKNTVTQNWNIEQLAARSRGAARAHDFANLGGYKSASFSQGGKTVTLSPYLLTDLLEAMQKAGASTVDITVLDGESPLLFKANNGVTGVLMPIRGNTSNNVIITEPSSTPDDTKPLKSTTPANSVQSELNAFGISDGIPAFLANVAKRGGKNYAPIAKLLLDAGAGNVEVRIVNLPNTDAAGFYVGANGVVHINTARNGPRGAVDTVLHELLHAVTEGSLKNPTPEQQKVIARIERVRATVTKRAKANGTFDNDLQYALGDNAEFLTHFFTSQRFRDQVSAMTPKSEKNWLQVIADLIADLFTGRTKAQKVEAELRKELTTLITAPRIGLAPSDVILNLPAYHATPHVVDQFSLNKIGTGEGAQAFGYGLYFAESEKVSGRGGVYDKKFESKTGKPSNIYRVELDVDTDTLLDWDKPLSGQQADLTAIVQWLKSDENFGGSALPAIERGEITGQKLYNVLTGEIGIRSSSAANPAKASEMMLSAGIKGIRYLDGESRNRPYREIKRGFLDALPDDASFDEVMEIIDDGTFNPQQVAFLKALDADDWFGFDYPAQAISAALSDKIGNWEPSPELRTTIDALRTESTYNYVIFDESAIKILDADIRFQPTSDARNVARFHQLTESLYQGRDSATAAEIEVWKAANPEKWSELAEMREEVLRAGGWDVKATHKTDAEFTEFSEKFTGGTGYYFDVSGDYEFRRNINMDVFLKLGAGLNKGEAFQKYPGSGGNPRRQTILQMKNAGYDHWFTESGEIAVFNSEQIKSADPISPGPRITPDRWADATSPDIRFQPAARPALLPTEQQFNETINQYVTGEWNPAQREARTDQFVREYAQRFAPTADRLGWVFEFTESGDVVAGLSERGKPQIEFGMARMRGQVSGSEVNTFRAVAKMVEEEFIHAAHLYYLTSEVADQGQRSAEVFRNSAKVFNQIIDSIRSDGGDAVTEAALASLQTYTPTMTLADLVKMANTSDYVAQDNFVNEFVRQMVQMQNGRPTEEYLAGNKNFLATFMDWLKEKLASLRWAAQNLNLVSPALKENVEGVQAILGDAASPDIRFQLAASPVDKLVEKGHTMLREDFDAEVAKLKPMTRDVFYVGDIEVVRNPTSADYQTMTKEVRSEFGRDLGGDPDIRFTQDQSGNRWIWKAYQGMHSQVEPGISRREGVEVNQNAAPPSHSEVVRQAIRDTKFIPEEVKAQYPQYAEFFNYTPTDIRFQGLTEQDFTPASLRDTATGFLPDDVTLNDLSIDFTDLADTVDGLDPVNAENAVHAAVNHALARRAGEAAIPAPARSEFDSDEAFDAATSEHAAEVARLTDTYELITRGRLTSEAMFRYRTNPGALARLVDYLTAAIKAAYARFTARYDTATAVALNRMSRDLAKARTGFNHDIEPSRGYDPEAVMMLPAVPDFYSQLERVIESKIPNRATPAQIMATIDPTRGSGVKAEEIKWSGIEQALQSLAVDGKVPKDALLAYLRDEGAVRFEEVVMQSQRMKRSDVDRQEELQRLRQTRRFTPEEAAELNAINARLTIGAEDTTKFGQYVLPGGENYREVVLAMPRPTGGVVASSKRFDAAKAKELVDQGVRVAGLESGVGVQRVTEKEIPDFSSFALLDDVIEANEQAESAPKSEYTSSHFPDVPNYVAHMRVDERTLPDGKRTMHAAEYQSDRHQEGRKKGYKDETKQQWYYLVVGEGFQTVPKFFDSEQEARETRANDSSARSGVSPVVDKNFAGVSDAPFRTTWPLALFKRHLRDAVAGGFDAVSWDTGETQNDRFDLSKQVDKLVLFPDMTVRAYKDGAEIISQKTTAEALPDLIGKDAAQKLLDAPTVNEAPNENQESEPHRKLEGNDLKVGGSGMKGFYDNMLPKEIGKYVKQWGGKVEQSNIGDSAVVTRRGNDWVVRLPDGETTRFGSETNAREYAGKFSLGATPIWRIDITPAMRESVSTQGQVRFLPAAQPASPARQEQQLLNAQAKNDGWVDLYKDDASVLATADKPEVKNKFLRRVVEALVNPFGALSASATKSVQNRAAMMQTVDYTVSTLGKRLQKAIRDEEADTTAVKLAVGNPDPLLTPSDETRIADDFTAEVDRVTDEIEATYEEELISDPANAEFNRAVAMAEMRREAERNRKIAIWQARNAEANRRREQQLQALAQLERTAPDTYEAIIDLRGMVNKLQRLAREVNADSPVIQAIIDQSQGVYLVRSFAVHQDPKQIDLMMNSQDPLYAERRGALTGFFRDKAYEQIMGELERDPDFLRAYGASYDYDTVLQDMDKRANEGAKTRAQDMFEDFMLGHEQSGGSFGQGSTVSNEIQRYMAKSNMPQEFLDALMVNEDPVFNLANTAMSLGRLVYNARMLQEIHDSGVESGRYITEAEMESGVTYADGKAEMRRVFGIDGSNDNIKLHVLNKITNLLHGELKKRYDDGTLDADPDKDQVRARVATALRSFADTDNVSLADLLPEIGRMADRHAVDAFISYGNKPQEVIANLQPRRGRFATWEPLVSANAGNAAFKPLGGLYADPEQVNAFAATFRTNAKGAEHFAMKALDVANRSLIGMAGASLAIATQGSPSYYVRNIVGNVFYGLINGVSPFDPQKVDLAARAAKSMLSERGEVSAEFQELIAGRIVFDAAKIGYLKQLIEDMTANPNATMQDIVGESVNADLKMQGLTKGAKAKTKAFMLRLGKFAEMTEVLSTVMIYADYKNILTEAGFGTEKEIIQEASRLTKRHTPGRSETASGVNAFTRTGFGAFLAPFLRFKVDNIRILPNIWMDAMTWSRSENPVLMKAGQRKLAAATATMGLITIALPLIFQRAIAGLGDDEDRAIRASLPEYYRNSSLFYFRNAENNGFNIVNLTYTNPLSFVGDPISRIANAVMTGNVSDIPAIMGRFVAEDFIGENIAASNVIDVARNIDSSTSYPIYFEADTGTDKVIKSALHILRSYNPRIVLQGSRFVDSLKREGEQDFWYSPLGVAFATVAPFRPISVSFDDMERRAFSSVRKENAELWRITSRVFSPAPLAPGDAEEMYEKRTAIMDRQAAKALDLYEGFSKIRNGDTTSVERSAVSAGISKTRARLLFNRGVTERLKFPDDDMRRIRQLDPARYAEVIEAVRSQPRFKPVER